MTRDRPDPLSPFPAEGRAFAAPGGCRTWIVTRRGRWAVQGLASLVYRDPNQLSQHHPGGSYRGKRSWR